MYQLIIVIHILLGLGVIGLVLMQQGKGADAGASFGSGASGSVFGAQGAASFLSRSTAVLATLFFCTSLGLAIINGQKAPAADIMSIPAVKKDNTIALPEVDGVTVPNKTVAIPDVKAPVVPVAPAMITPEKPVSSVVAPALVAPEAKQEKADTATQTVEEKPVEVKKPEVEVTKPVKAKTVEKAKSTEKSKKSVEKTTTEKKTVEKKKATSSTAAHTKDDKKK